MDLISSEDKGLAGRTAAFFDLDRTVISEISGMALVRTAWKNGLIRPADIFSALFLYMLYKMRIRDPLEVIDDMTGWVRGKTVEEMKRLCDLTSVEILIPSVYEEARTEISLHGHSGRPVVILSSSLDDICLAMKTELGIEDFICSSLESVEGMYTGKPSGRLCFGPEKLTRLTGYCKAGNIDLSGSWYYSDAISDLPVFEAVVYPVCVNPDRALRREGKRRGWTILEWHPAPGT